MTKKQKIILVVILAVIIIGGILIWQSQYRALKEEIKQVREMCRKKILCEVNIETDEVRIRVKEDGKMPAFYKTNKSGRTYIPFDEGKTYQITADYKNNNKEVTLKYDGFGYLIIEVNQNKNSVEDIFFGVTF